MLCFHNSARILTEGINSQVTKYHKDKAVKSAHKVFYSTKKSNSRQLRILNPLDCKQKLTGEIIKL